MICIYYLTFDCKSQCEFCGIWRDEDLKDTPNSSFCTVKNNVDELKDLGIAHVFFTGGEPLLHDDAAEIISYSKKAGLKVSVYSSGECYLKKSGELKDNIDYLYLPLDAPSEDLHNEIRGSKCYANNIDAVNKAFSFNILPVLNFTMTRSTIQYLPEMVELSQKISAPLKINPLFDAGGLEGFENSSLDYIKRYQNIRNVYVNKAVIEFMRKKGNSKKKPVCLALDAAITISPDDHLILPCFVNKQAHVPIEGRLKAVYNSDIVKGYKKLEGRLDKCEGCMCWDYIIPSFEKKFNRYFLLDLFSKKL